MGDEATTQKLCTFFSSESWWKPVCGFLATNCAKFDDDKNKLEQYGCLCDFKVLITELIDVMLCKTINTRSSMLENIIFQGLENNDERFILIVDTLRKLLDFNQFKEEMKKTSQRISDDVTEAMENIRNQTADDTNDNDLALSVADILEKGEEISLQKQTQKMCEEYSQKFKEMSHTQNFAGGSSPNGKSFPHPKSINTKELGPLKALGPLTPPVAGGGFASPSSDKKLFAASDNIRRSQNGGKPLIMRPGVNKKSSVLAPLK